MEVTDTLFGRKRIYVLSVPPARRYGLQFVVIALVAESPRRATTKEIGMSAPTTIDFCAVLLMSAILSAPWQVGHRGWLLRRRLVDLPAWFTDSCHSARAPANHFIGRSSKPVWHSCCRYSHMRCCS